MRAASLSTFTAWVGLAACNVIVGNQSGTAVLREEGGVGAGSSSSSGSSAAADASSSSSSGAAVDAASITCACGADGDGCSLCALEPVPLAADLSALAATTTALNASRHEGYQRIRYPRVDDVIAIDDGIESADMSTFMLSATPRVGSRVAQPFFYNLLFGRNAGWFSFCKDAGLEDCKEPSLQGAPLQMASTEKGALVLVYKATSGFNFHWLDGDAVRELTCFYAPPNMEIPITAHADHAYWYVPSFPSEPPRPQRQLSWRELNDDGATGVVQLAQDQPEIAHMAANDEELFVSPCAGGLLCAYRVPLLGSATPRVLLAPGSNAMVIDTLYADQNVLYFNVDGRAMRCAVTHCAPESIDADNAESELRSLTHTAQYTYLQVGARTLRTPRSPLRPAP